MAALTVTKQEYNNLKAVLLEKSYLRNMNHFSKLKFKYTGAINSERRLGLINTLEQLLDVLERRDIVSENDIGVLEELAEETGNIYFMGQVDNIRSNFKQTYGINSNRILKNPNENLPYYHDRNADSYNVKTRIREVIATQLGNKWVDFARELNFLESKIDNLKMKYDNTEMCINEVLDFHEQNVHPREWKTLLLNALEKARRNDIKKEVDRLSDNF